MIRLRSDCLVFNLPNGESVPMSPESISVELAGSALNAVDAELVRNAAVAVLHFFRTDLKRTSVTLSEFSEALETVLQSLGVQISSVAPPFAESDLRQLACQSGKGFELIFFTLLRDALRRGLSESPSLVRFHGLRGCVKQLVGARRWSTRCQKLNDQIVEYLRTCLASEPHAESCRLVVQ